MYKLLTLSLICLIGFGCNKNQIQSIEIPDNLELDVDQNGDCDFIVTYSKQTESDPVGNYEAVRANLESKDMNQILKNLDEFPFFLNDTDLIQPEVNSPLYWETTNPSSNIFTPIARIRTDYDRMTWGDEWIIFSQEEKEKYLIGFKLLGDNTIQFGYIEFSVDSQTGEFTLLKSELL
jgi:hypothetical protein